MRSCRPLAELGGTSPGSGGGLWIYVCNAACRVRATGLLERNVMEKRKRKRSLKSSQRSSVKIANYHQEVEEELARNDPYQLEREFMDISFEAADNLAKKVHIEHESLMRVLGGVRSVLNQAGGHGHIYLPQEELIRKAQKVLSMGREPIKQALKALRRDKKLLVDRWPLLFTSALPGRTRRLHLTPTAVEPSRQSAQQTGTAEKKPGLVCKPERGCGTGFDQ